MKEYLKAVRLRIGSDEVFETDELKPRLGLGLGLGLGLNFVAHGYWHWCGVMLLLEIELGGCDI